MGKKINQDDFEKRIKVTHPFSDLEIIKFTTIKDEMIYRCKKCNKVYTLKRAEGIFSKTNPCTCEKNFNSRADKINFFEKQQDKIKVLLIGRTNSELFCNNCKKNFTRTTVSLMASFDNCPYCNNGVTKQTNSIEDASATIKKIFPNHNYQILEYKTFHQKCKIKCLDCHFVYEGNFDGFLNSRGCPRCHRKISHGEEKIKKFLEEKKIKFIQQKNLDLERELKRYKFDFFLPDFNLGIEYNGEQHYQEKTGFFDGLKKTQKRDKTKREYCLRHNIELLVIPYWDFSNIEEILLKWFNDYSKRK